MPTLTPLQVAAAAYLGGFRGQNLIEAVAVARGESSYNTELFNGSCCYGLFQVHRKFHEKKVKAAGGSWEAWKNPVVNAKVAYQIYSSEGGWCRGKNPPNCNPYQAYGVSNSGMTWAQKLAEGKKASQQLDHAWSKDRLKNVATLKTKADTALGILTGSAAGSLLDGFIANNEAILDATADAVDDVVPDAFASVNALADALQDKDTWIRAAEVLLGTVIVVVALSKLLSATSVGKTVVNATPMGKVAKVLK